MMPRTIAPFPFWPRKVGTELPDIQGRCAEHHDPKVSSHGIPKTIQINT